MRLTILSFGNGEVIPDEFAFGIPSPEGRMAFGPNRNPHIVWSDVPAGAQSLALIVHDPDVPSVGDDVNQEGRTVPHDLPRVDFFHWVLVDIPPGVTELPAGVGSQGIVPRGKPYGSTAYGVQGINSYTGWFAGDPDMAGDYGGYDGPCPPWNDERLHHYHFTLYALDIPTLDLSGPFDGPAVRAAIEGHVLDSAEWVGTYALNPALRR